MSWIITWSVASKDEYAEILNFLDQKYGLESALKFMDATDNVLDTISLFPKAYPSSNFEDIRKAVITKQTSLYYRIKEDIIELVHFWDNRQSEDLLRELFK